MRIDQVPPYCSEVMLRSLILSALLRIVLTHAAILPMLEAASDARCVSSLKLFSLVEALDSIGEDSGFGEQLQRENALRHCRYERLKRKSLPQRLNTLGSRLWDEPQIDNLRENELSLQEYTGTGYAASRYKMARSANRHDESLAENPVLQTQSTIRHTPSPERASP